MIRSNSTVTQKLVLRRANPIIFSRPTSKETRSTVRHPPWHLVKALMAKIRSSCHRLAIRRQNQSRARVRSHAKIDRYLRLIKAQCLRISTIGSSWMSSTSTRLALSSYLRSAQRCPRARSSPARTSKKSSASRAQTRASRWFLQTCCSLPTTPSKRT